MTNPKSRAGVSNFRYAQLADDLETKIRQGVYKAGEKLPSLRVLHDRTRLSITTVYQAYMELEKRGIVEPREKSGFYVRPVLRRILPPVEHQPPELIPEEVSVQTLVAAIHASMSDPTRLQFGCATPGNDIMPARQLARAVKSMPLDRLADIIGHYDHPAGLLELRRQIVKRSAGPAAGSGVDDIVITSGCMEALSLSLQAVAEPGDTVAVESPTFHCILQLIEDLNMRVLELPTDPRQGIDLEALVPLLDQHPVSAAIVIPTFHNPLGFCMSAPRKKELVRIMAMRRIPLIEDDIYGELYFSRHRPPTLKSYDRDGMVLYCSSFSKTLAPGLRVGWCAPGQFIDNVQRRKINTTIVSPTLNQTMVAEFLKSGAFDRHLRGLRNHLKNSVSATAMAVARHFPDGTKLSSPAGGLVLWVQLPEGVDGMALFRKAGEQKISIFPGCIFAGGGRYQQYIRLNCGRRMTDTVADGIARLGSIARDLAAMPPVSTPEDIGAV